MGVYNRCHLPKWTLDSDYGQAPLKPPGTSLAGHGHLPVAKKAKRKLTTDITRWGVYDDRESSGGELSETDDFNQISTDMHSQLCRGCLQAFLKLIIQWAKEQQKVVRKDLKLRLTNISIIQTVPTEVWKAGN